MNVNQLPSTTHRRGFLGAITKSAAAFGLSGLVSSFTQVHAADAGSREISTYAPRLMQINGLTS